MNYLYRKDGIFQLNYSWKIQVEVLYERGEKVEMFELEKDGFLKRSELLKRVGVCN